ncbi:hypothetical protein HELRODRAFT_168373 [Helobdella robusta]|uniref:SUEL-type lectin domain-containing protein n=1 Tax=Helobdella robusta TaxID=6412 RepID=T1F0I0_HELRO|nr:hypothetical protein HELRODRAFT_168373 [Helobdella robusta]ESO09391.1 hypothetical protein HELRODRAFT_168373 [Helobdella robusta]
METVNITCSHRTASSSSSSSSSSYSSSSSSSFSLSKPLKSVVLMTLAKYGRMELGKCVQRNLGFLGCFDDVTKVLDERCSGREKCIFKLPDPIMFTFQTCPHDVTPYLHVEYSCLPVEDDGNICQSQTVKSTLQSQYISSEILTSEIDKKDNRRVNTNLNNFVSSSSNCAFIIEASPGQQINLTILNFFSNQYISKNNNYNGANKNIISGNNHRINSSTARADDKVDIFHYQPDAPKTSSIARRHEPLTPRDDNYDEKEVGFYRNDSSVFKNLQQIVKTNSINLSVFNTSTKFLQIKKRDLSELFNPSKTFKIAPNRQTPVPSNHPNSPLHLAQVASSPTLTRERFPPHHSPYQQSYFQHSQQLCIVLGYAIEIVPDTHNNNNHNNVYEKNNNLKVKRNVNYTSSELTNKSQLRNKHDENVKKFQANVERSQQPERQKEITFRREEKTFLCSASTKRFFLAPSGRRHIHTSLEYPLKIPRSTT